MDFDFRNFTGLTEVEDDTSDGVLATRFIIGRDFAVTRSPPESCVRAHCGTEMANIEQAQQMIPLITCEISFG